MRHFIVAVCLRAFGTVRVGCFITLFENRASMVPPSSCLSCLSESAPPPSSLPPEQPQCAHVPHFAVEDDLEAAGVEASRLLVRELIKLMDGLDGQTTKERVGLVKLMDGLNKPPRWEVGWSNYEHVIGTYRRPTRGHTG